MLGGSNTQRLVDAFTGVLTNVSPLTGVKVDDALLRLLKDVQQPGQPSEEVINPFGAMAGVPRTINSDGSSTLDAKTSAG